MRERWGKKFIDNRDWPECNERRPSAVARLVKRGEYFLALDFVGKWNEELDAMNRGKVGAPYEFPTSLIELQALRSPRLAAWHAKRLDYRMIEGMTRDLAEIGQLPHYNNYSTVNRRATESAPHPPCGGALGRRVNGLGFQLAPPSGRRARTPQGDSIIVFSDGTERAFRP